MRRIGRKRYRRTLISRKGWKLRKIRKQRATHNAQRKILTCSSHTSSPLFSLREFPAAICHLFLALDKTQRNLQKGQSERADKAQGRNSLAGGQNKSAHTDKPVDTLHK